MHRFLSVHLSTWVCGAKSHGSRSNDACHEKTNLLKCPCRMNGFHTKAGGLATTLICFIYPTGLKQWECIYCNKWFPNQWALRDHKAHLHVAERPFKCRVPGCWKAFDNQNGKHKNYYYSIIIIKLNLFRDDIKISGKFPIFTM